MQRAAEGLIRANVSLDPEAILASGLPDALRWRLMRQAPGWTSSIAVLKRAEKRPGSHAWLDRWTTRTLGRGVAPKPEEWIEAKATLDAVEGALPRATVAALRKTLRTSRPE